MSTTASKETAFYPRLKELTDEWMDLFGYWAPTEVTDTQEEYRAVRETAGLMDFTMLRKVDIDGEGAQDFVNTIVTRDVSKLTPGQIAYGALTDEDGKMVDDCTSMMRSPDRIRFCGANDRDYEIFSEKAPDGITVREFTDAMPHLCLQGPKSREMLQGLANQDLSNEAFPYYTFREDVEIAGIPVFMTRLGYTAELGYELWVERDRALDLWDALVAHTRAAGHEDHRDGRARPLPHRGRLHHRRHRVRPDGVTVRVRARVVRRPRQGRLPGQGGARARQGRNEPPPDERRARERRRRGLAAGEIGVDGEEVGLVTQAVSSPYLGGRTLGLAKIRKDLKQPGQNIEVQVGVGNRARRGRRPPGLRQGAQAGEGELSASQLDALGRLGEHVSEDSHDLVELGLVGDERRRDLDDRVAAVVGTADEPALPEPGREEAAQERLALLVGEGLAGLLVLHELERVEEPGPAQVADDREVEELRQRVAEVVLLLGDVLDDPLPLHDLDVLERDRGHARGGRRR